MMRRLWTPILLLLPLLAGCQSPRDEAAPPPEVPPAALPAEAPDVDRERPGSALGDMEWAFHQAINAHRANSGLPPLAFDNQLADLARAHSRDMASGAVEFGHDGFDERWKALEGRRFSSFAENVATNNYSRDATVQRAVTGLLNSPGHRKNIDGQFSVTGVGVAVTPAGDWYFTQLFAR
jgi:uncharacterized protein YkwD